MPSWVIRNFKGIKRRKFTHFPLMTNSYRTDSEMMKDEIAELRFMGRKIAPTPPARERQEGCPGNVLRAHIRQMLVSGRPAWREKRVEGSRLCVATRLKLQTMSTDLERSMLLQRIKSSNGARFAGLLAGTEPHSPKGSTNRVSVLKQQKSE